MTTIEITDIETPVGAAVIAVKDDHLVGLTFAENTDWLLERLTDQHPGCSIDRVDQVSVEARLDAYFAGDLAALSDTHTVELTRESFPRVRDEVRSWLEGKIGP